ncbi:MAG: autotransporter assembly complex family protein [Gammaproteobacteria bacterium]|nr:autotransporter assembly complex family protein [Gammaproteobacteria bacterium]
MRGKDREILRTLWQILFVLITSHAVAAQEKPAAIAVNVIVEGLGDKEKKNALAYLEIVKNQKDLNELWLKQLHSRAQDNIKQSLRPFGYYQAVVESHLEKDSRDVWQARYQVKTGKRVKILKVDIRLIGGGANEPEILAAVKKFPIKVNDFLDHDVYEAGKSDLLSLIGNLGYSDVKTDKKRLLIDPPKNSAEITLHINTGEKYYLGQFRFQQNSLQPDFINRYIVDVKPGDPFSHKRLLALQQSLVSSGYFSVVDIKPEYSETEQQHVPVDIILTQAKRHKLSFGLGYDTEIDLNASIRWQNRLLNSYGHNTDVLLKISDKKSMLSGTYWIPINDPRTDKIGFTTKFETEETDDTDRNTLDLEAAWVFKWREWNSKLFTEYKFERFESGTEPETITRLLSLGSQLEGVFIAKGMYPRKGWSAFAELRGAPELIWSDTDYVRLHLKSRLLLPLQEEGRFILRAELGLAEVGDFDQYPTSLRFFAGGDQSVRGYDWKALGPVDDAGDVVGGKNVVTASIEYNHKISQQWIAAAFLDMGNAYNDEFNKLYYGAGFGARWISPVGLIRADMGWPINEDDEETKLSSLVFYFGFEVSL